MAKITRAQIMAAKDNLACIRDLAKDSPDGKGPCYRFHARSASRSIDLLVKAGAEVPDWIRKDWRWLSSLGWSGFEPPSIPPATTCIEHGPGGPVRLSFQIKVF